MALKGRPGKLTGIEERDAMGVIKQWLIKHHVSLTNSEIRAYAEAIAEEINNKLRSEKLSEEEIKKIIELNAKKLITH